MGLVRVDVSRRLGVAVVAAFALVACAESADDGGNSGAGAMGGFGGTGGTGGVSGTAGLGGTGGVSGVGGGVGGMGGGQVGADVPCNVETVIKSRCGTCHGASPIGGAPMPLVTLADFTKDYTVISTTQLAGQTMKVHELVKIRINQEQGTAPMPQGLPMPAEELTMLNSWLTGGAVGGTACGDVNPMGGGVGGVGGVGGGGGMGGITDLCGDSSSAAYQPLVARDGEVCYDFLTHNGGFEGDPFVVQPDESYNQLYYDIPWPDGTVATRFGADFDNLGVLHHWLGFETKENFPHGHVATNVTGSVGGVVGGDTDAKLFGGWAVGGCNVEFPSDMGLQLPNATSGMKIMIQWHHYNFTGVPQLDASKVQVCTVPANVRPNVGGLTWLGTENFNGPFGMPPGVESKFSGTCLNETSAPITIVAFWPHMHEIGTHMFTEVLRGGTTAETVFDKPFQFDHQIHYDLDPYVVLQPGDKIRAECTFFNGTSGNVAFGQSTTQEMCYQFAFSYPVGALDKADNLSLIGATNTCWGDDL
jgi:hypothetical protein